MQNAIDRLRSAVRTLPGILAGFSEAEAGSGVIENTHTPGGGPRRRWSAT